MSITCVTLLLQFSDVRSVFDVIQQCENGGRTYYCRFDISTYYLGMNCSENSLNRGVSHYRILPVSRDFGWPVQQFVFVAVFLGCTSTGRVGLFFLWFYVQELPKAQPAVVLVLKRLRRRGNGLKSHPTDWEKPGIEPATPGLQDIGLSPTPRRLLASPAIGLLGI